VLFQPTIFSTYN